MPERPVVLVLNGANLNLLGTREPAVYGAQTLADVEQLCHAEAQRLGLAVEFRQTNHEGELLEWVHEGGRRHQDGEVLGAVATYQDITEVQKLEQKIRIKLSPSCSAACGPVPGGVF